MSIRIMIIDGHADFRDLLAHHVTAHWHDAIISSYDPTVSGHLPDEFSGARNDVIMLGDDQGDRDARVTLRQFASRPGFPGIVFFGGDRCADATEIGASAFMERGDIRHRTLIGHVKDILSNGNLAASRDTQNAGDQVATTRLRVRGYHLLKRLAAGKHSAVFLAERESDGKPVALKVLTPVPESVEAMCAFVGDDHAHIAMEYLPGGDLSRKIESGMSEADALGYARQIASALDDLHSVGILHRDLKPGNVMLRKDGSIALIDFGLARRMQQERDAAGGEPIFGTPHYMSPEQGRGRDVDARSDLYALGIVLYEMLTGMKPFGGRDPMSVIFNHGEAPVPALPENLSGHQVVIDRLLAKRPEDRFQSAAELAEWL
jgi:predicted Ser/Thr protein kinase